MANLSLPTELPKVLDQRQVWFTNLLLLGFDPVAQEDKTKVNFCKEMFGHINKKGMEVTLHYLFNRLDSHIAYEEFRDCWPVYDKKQESQFRKVCSNWLTRISKEAPESKIPRLSASLLMSPGGERFEQLMLRFTAYILRVMCLREAKGEEKQVFLSTFVTSPASLRPSPTNPHLLRRALQCHIIRHCQRVVQRLELTSALHQHWRQFVTEQVREYRSLGKEKRELEAQLKQISASHSSAGGERVSAGSTPAADRARKNKMKQVRSFWKSLDEFLSKSAHEREVVGAVAKGNANKYTIDAKDLQFQIPDVVLHMYEAKLREGTVGNTYEGGKLNLVSLIQLWNCALQVMRERFIECELPSFQEESEEMKELLQAHRVNLTTSQNLRASLMEYKQSLQESIEKLERELQVLREPSSQNRSEGKKENRETDLPPSSQLHIPPITLPSLGLELLPPSPQKSQSLSSPEMRHLQDHLSHLSLLPSDHVSTPEAVHSISVSVQRQSRSQEPIHSRSHSSSPPKSTLHHLHQLPPSTDSVGDTQRAAPSSQKSTLPLKSRRKREKSSQARPHPPITSSSSRVSGREATPTIPRTGVRGLGPPQIMPTNPRLMEAMPAAHDILASQIAAAVADGSSFSPTSPHTPEQDQIHALADPTSALGRDAFVSHDKIPRTPDSKHTATASDSSPSSVRVQEDSPSHLSGVGTPYTTSSLLTPVTNITTPPTLSHTPTGSTSLPTPVPNITTPPTLSHTPTGSTSLLTPVPNITTPPTLSHTPTGSISLLTPVPNITTPSTLSHTPTGSTSLLTPVTNITTPPTGSISLLTPVPNITTPPTLSHAPTGSTSLLTPVTNITTPPTLSHTPTGSTSLLLTPVSLPSVLPKTPTNAGSLATPFSTTRASHIPFSTNTSLTPPPQPPRFTSPKSFSQTFTPSQPPQPLTSSPHIFKSPLHNAPLSPLQPPAKEVSPLISFSTSPLLPSPSTAAQSTPTVDLLIFNSPVTEGQGSNGSVLFGRSPLMPQSFKSPLLGSSAGPMLQFSPSLFATPVATTVDASVVTHAVGIGTPVPPSGEPQATTHDRRETKATTPLVPKTTGTHTWSSISSSPQQPHDSLATVNPVVGGGSAQRAHSNYSVTTTPLAFSMTAKSSPFLLSSTPPFLHDSATSDEQSEGEREEEREEEGEGENDHHLVLSASTSHGGLGRDEAIGPEEKQLTGPTGAQKESLTDLHTELKPNGIPLGLQIPSSVQLSGLAVESPSPSTSALASTRHTSSPAWGGVQLIDLSLPPGLDEREWRPLDVSEDHSNSLSPSPPHNQSFKLVGDKHQLSSSGDGLFDEDDSLLVPLSPHSDFSNQDEDGH